MSSAWQADWVVDLVQRLPQGAMSRAWGWVARRRRPRAAVGALKRAFVAIGGIDMSEAAQSVDAYDTLEDLFVRRLRPGIHRIAPELDAVVSSVDGTVGACGAIEDGTLLQVKGKRYSVARLLDDADEAERFDGGAFVTLYLAPHNYHRIHAPVAGDIVKASLVPGALMPVFSRATERIDELFARNERLVTYLESKDAGRVAVVKVGATLVGRISVTYDDTLVTNLAGSKKREAQLEPPLPVQKGAELGAFELGSTVVLLFQRSFVALEQQLCEGAPIRMGQRIGSVLSRASRKKRTGKRPTGERSTAP